MADIKSKKLALFPMTRDQCAIARHGDLLNGYTLSLLLTPSFLLRQGEDICLIDGGGHTGQTLTDYNDDVLTDCDALLLDYDATLTSLDMYNDVINAAKDADTEIILTDLLAHKLEQMRPLTITQVPFASDPETDRLVEISMPVITVLAQGYYTDQLAVTLALHRHFKSAGYHVMQVGCREYAKLFDYIPLPDFLYEPIDAYDKILRFNKFINELTATHETELLLICIPEPIMKFDVRYRGCK